MFAVNFCDYYFIDFVTIISCTVLCASFKNSIIIIIIIIFFDFVTIISCIVFQNVQVSRISIISMGHSIQQTSDVHSK